jgi:mannose-6-phosphate isomerase class I
MIYSQENITKNKFKRVFESNVDDHELVWHRDKRNRLVEVLNENDWMFQFDNELPKKLNKGELLFIESEKFHRVIKGTTPLEIMITEEKTYRVPPQVKENYERFKKYFRKSKISKEHFSNLLENSELTLSEIKEMKKYFDSQKSNVLLENEFKGNPHNSENYLKWLSYGGEPGQNWVLKVSRFKS